MNDIEIGDTVALNINFYEYDLYKDTIGVVTNIYRNGKVFEVQFINSAKLNLFINQITKV